MDARKLSPKALAGQRLMAGFNGTVFNQDIKYLIRDLHIGGLILFSRNIESPDQIRALTESAQAYAKSLDQPPLFIAVDQEGGAVARLKEPFFTQFPGNPHIKQRREAMDFAAITAEELKGVNINMNLAPVLDVDPGDMESIMTGRVFQGDAPTVSDLGCCVIETLQALGIMAVAKHFPGIGRTTLDSHLHLPRLDTPLHQLEKTDFKPFIAAIQSNVSGIMLSHILYTDLDDRWPASLSVNIAKKILRDRLGYRGLVMTDDLDMKAVKHDIKQSVNQILAADVDMALICHKGPDIDTAFNEITRLLSEDNTTYLKGVESTNRILKAKKKWVAG